MLPSGPDEDAGDLPRSQHGANPQHVMAALLGDYWLDRDEHLPSASLVDLVRDFDVTTASARAALSRLLRRGTLDVHKLGRNTFYRLSAPARARLTQTRNLLVASTTSTTSTTSTQTDWDGRWLVVAFSVSEDRREVRHSLRSGLRRLGFGPLYDGVWACPHTTTDTSADPSGGPTRDGLLRRLLADLDVDQATIMHSSVLHPADGAGHPTAAWDLAALADRYRHFTRTCGTVLDDLASGTVPPSAALRLRAETLRVWRGLVDDEPALPAALLPAGWPRPEATEAFVRLLDGLAPLAEQRFREAVAAQAPDLAPLAAARRLGASGAPRRV